MARISTRSLLDGGQRIAPPTTVTPATTATTATSAISPQDVRDPVTGLTPAQVAAQKALAEAVAAGEKLGIKTTPKVATAGNVPTVTVTNRPTGPTGPGPTGPRIKTKKEVGREAIVSGMFQIKSCRSPRCLISPLTPIS